MVLELMVSQEGGIPLLAKCFDGNASDNKIFKERCEQLVQQFKESDAPHYVVADSKLYHKKNIAHLKELSFITRIPRTFQEENRAIKEAITKDAWIALDGENFYYEQPITHYAIEQRWLVVRSNAALERAEKTVSRQIEKEFKKGTLQLKHLRNELFNCEADAKKALEKINIGLKYHELKASQINEKKQFSTPGRPKKESVANNIFYSVTAQLEFNEEKKSAFLVEKSCYVLGTNVNEEGLSCKQIIGAYKNQNRSVERGFRFLKDPIFFVSSLFLKKPARMMSLVMLMTLSLLVYSVAQRRLRQSLKEANEVIPNQINEPTQTPTLRWVFQLFEGIDVIYLKLKCKVKRLVLGVNSLREKILNYFGQNVQSMYEMSG